MKNVSSFEQFRQFQKFFEVNFLTQYSSQSERTESSHVRATPRLLQEKHLSSTREASGGSLSLLENTISPSLPSPPVFQPRPKQVYPSFCVVLHYVWFTCSARLTEVHPVWFFDFFWKCTSVKSKYVKKSYLQKEWRVNYD